MTKVVNILALVGAGVMMAGGVAVVGIATKKADVIFGLGVAMAGGAYIVAEVF